LAEWDAASGWSPCETDEASDECRASDPCAGNGWYGVACDSTVVPPRVIGLDLRRNGLVNPLPDEIGDFERLEHLDLSGNAIWGTLPSSLGKLSDLRVLAVAATTSSLDLGGTIPQELGKLAKLTFLDLHGNQLEGEIPSSLGNLVRLEHLDLSGNEGLTGSIPARLHISGDFCGPETNGLEPDGLGGCRDADACAAPANGGCGDASWGTCRDVTAPGTSRACDCADGFEPSGSGGSCRPIANDGRSRGDEDEDGGGDDVGTASWSSSDDDEDGASLALIAVVVAAVLCAGAVLVACVVVRALRRRSGTRRGTEAGAEQGACSKTEDRRGSIEFRGEEASVGGGGGAQAAAEGRTDALVETGASGVAEQDAAQRSVGIEVAAADVA
jgi:hypothetical protein